MPYTVVRSSDALQSPGCQETVSTGFPTLETRAKRGQVFVTLLLLNTVMPWARKDPRGGGAAVVLGVGVACTFGGVLTPIAGAPASLVHHCRQ